MLESSVMEFVKWFIGLLSFMFIFFIVLIFFRINEVNTFQQTVNSQIERHGGLTVNAMQELDRIARDSYGGCIVVRDTIDAPCLLFDVVIRSTGNNGSTLANNHGFILYHTTLGEVARGHTGTNGELVLKAQRPIDSSTGSDDYVLYPYYTRALPVERLSDVSSVHPTVNSRKRTVSVPRDSATLVIEESSSSIASARDSVQALGTSPSSGLFVREYVADPSTSELSWLEPIRKDDQRLPYGSVVTYGVSRQLGQGDLIEGLGRPMKLGESSSRIRGSQ